MKPSSAGFITRRARFSAAHGYHNLAWSDEKNREDFGPCNNPYSCLYSRPRTLA